MKKNKICFLVLAAVLFLILPQGASQALFTGATFEDRKEAYINDAGKSFSASFPVSMNLALWAWLERPSGHEKQISEEINYLLADPCIVGASFGNCWFLGHHPATVYASRIYSQYYLKKKVISDADALKIKNKLWPIAQNENIFCAVPNFMYQYLAAGYFYASQIEDFNVIYPQPSADKYGCPPAAFTVDGRTYESGKTYRASEIYRDYLEYLFSSMIKSGNNEDLAPGTYYYDQFHAIVLIYDFTSDPVMKQKAKMIIDWMLFQMSVGFNAYHLAGGHGRIYQWDERDAAKAFPFTVFYNLSVDADGILTRREMDNEMYVISYRYPKLLADFFEDLNGANANEPDNFYRLIRGSQPYLSPHRWEDDLIQFGYRYDYITPFYNLGGTGIGTGWELNVKTSNGTISLWTNSCPVNSITGKEATLCTATGPQAAYNIYNIIQMGLERWASQYRNAILSFRNNTTVYDYSTSGNYWDEKSYESGWNFYREGKVAAAVQVQARAYYPAAVEVAIIGVDYLSYADFKKAVIDNAKLDQTKKSFTTSKNFEINYGFVDYPPDNPNQPFDRLEVWEGHVGANDEKKVVDWNNDVMTVNRNGLTCRYDFNNWTYIGNGCEGSGTPSRVYKADLNSDNKVDSQDFGILISKWGETNNLTVNGKNLDLIRDDKIDARDLGAMFSCWGTPTNKTFCFE